MPTTFKSARLEATGENARTRQMAEDTATVRASSGAKRSIEHVSIVEELDNGYIVEVLYE